VFAIVLMWITLNLLRWPRLMRLAAALIVAGAIGNGLVIAANGRMPYAPQAAVQAHLPATAVGPKNQPADDGTRFAFLGDVIPLVPLGKVLSAGDLLIAAGASAAVAVAMRRRGGTAPATTVSVQDLTPVGSTATAVSPCWDPEGGEHEADQLDPARRGAVCPGSPGHPALHHRRAVSQRGVKGRALKMRRTVRSVGANGAWHS